MMGLGSIDNCPTCGKLFVKGVTDICPACYKEVEKQYETCHEFLRLNKRCTITEMSEETGVPIKQITRFIREGRLSLAHAPNMGFPCEVCGTMIREGTICDSCRQKLVKDIRNMREDNDRKEELQRQEGKVQYKIQDRLKDRLGDHR